MVLTLVLAVYWLSMFTGTHIPKVPVELAGHGDKSLHFVAYFGLGLLLLQWRSARRASTWRSVIGMWLVIGAYGAFDELTQPIFGRDAEWGDWFADLLGEGVGLAISWPIAVRHG